MFYLQVTNQIQDSLGGYAVNSYAFPSRGDGLDETANRSDAWAAFPRPRTTNSLFLALPDFVVAYKASK